MSSSTKPLQESSSTSRNLLRVATVISVLAMLLIALRYRNAETNSRQEPANTVDVTSETNYESTTSDEFVELQRKLLASLDEEVTKMMQIDPN